jgi:hypothetical protein
MSEEVAVALRHCPYFSLGLSGRETNCPQPLCLIWSGRLFTPREFPGVSLPNEYMLFRKYCFPKLEKSSPSIFVCVPRCFTIFASSHLISDQRSSGSTYPCDQFPHHQNQTCFRAIFALRFADMSSTAQRPCSRCLSNGKEDTCVDVQHKKRGRPRLRDEREPRYEALGPNYPPPPDVSMRRPLSLYTEAPFPAFGESHQRSGPYRVLKSQSAMSGPITPRYLEHASPADANIYGPWAPPTLRMLAPQEPICAYLNMEMQIAKASQGFGETIGIQPVVSRKLHDIVAANDRDKVFRLQRLFEDERREREPNYLPPIYLKLEEDRVIQAVALGPDALAQFRTERQERVTFQGPDGQQRAFQVRFGLAKKESTYFIVLVLDIPATPQSYPHNLSAPYPREPYSRDSQYGFQPAQQQPYPNPSVPPFVANTPFGDPRGEMSTYRMTGPMGPNVPSSTNMTVPSPPQRRQDYSQGQNNPYQTPRSELPPSPESQRQRDLQLPPIREQRGEGYSADSMQRRDDRSNRFDIGGLLARSDHAGGGH